MHKLWGQHSYTSSTYSIAILRRRGGLSDHFLVEARLKLLGGWRSAGKMEGVRNVLKVSELNHSVKVRAYQESLHGKYEVWIGGEVESVEKEWEKFRDMVMECTNDVCGMRLVGGQRRMGSKWWNEEVGRAVAKKRRAFGEWLQRRDKVTFDRYRAQRVAVQAAKWRTGDGESDWGMISRVTKRCFGNR